MKSIVLSFLIVSSLFAFSIETFKLEKFQIKNNLLIFKLDQNKYRNETTKILNICKFASIDIERVGNLNKIYLYHTLKESGNESHYFSLEINNEEQRKEILDQLINTFDKCVY